MEEALDAISSSVKSTIKVAATTLSCRVTADDHLHAPMTNAAHQSVRVITSITKQRAALRVVNEFVGGTHFVPMPRRQRYVQRQPLHVGDYVDLRREATSRTTQSVTVDPPFPPAASWCARMVLPSTIEPVLSTRICSALNTRFQIPRRDQLLKRLYTLFHGPKRSGKSRHGIPVFAR